MTKKWTLYVGSLLALGLADASIALFGVATVNSLQMFWVGCIAVLGVTVITAGMTYVWSLAWERYG